MSAQLLQLLSEFDFIVVIDASGSMGEKDMAGGKSRWEYMQETTLSFVRDLEAIDTDGVDVITFGGDNIDVSTGVTSDKVKEVFAKRAPRGGTPLTEALHAAFKAAGKSDKKDFIIVFTDGVPNDKASAAKAIIEQSHKQETDDALTVLFVQVGNDPEATKFLTSLDDDLTDAKFDIVDAKTFSQAEAFATTAELVAAAIND
jgi:Mg-chelatase subunit ChlD